MDEYDTNPLPTDKVFSSRIDGQSATSEVIGNLQCKRAGAVTQQSIVNPDLYYVCGGLYAIDIDSDKCTMCEVFDVNLGKGAPIDVEFKDYDCSGVVVGLRIVQDVGDSSNSSSFGWVQVEYACSDNEYVRDYPQNQDGTAGDNFYLEVPPIMVAIHTVKTHYASSRQTFSFTQVALKDNHGTFEAFPLNAVRIPKQADGLIAGYGTPSFCFHPNFATAVMTLKIPTSTISVRIQGLDVVALSDVETVTKRISAEGFTCVDGNGVSQIVNNNTRSMGFWNPLKFDDANLVDVSIEFLTLENAEYAFHFFTRDTLLENGNMVDVFSNVRWKMGKTGYIQTPKPEVKWGCTFLADNTPFCGRSVTCDNSTVKCTTEYYDDTTDLKIQQTQENILKGIHVLSGYLTPRELLLRQRQTKFASFPASFDLVPGVFGKDDCDAVRKALPFENPVMMLVNTPMLERTSRPHFVEAAPTMFVRTSEACHENSTACHTFSQPDSGNGLKICRHFVGCTKEEFVNITSQATDPPQYECVGFEKCQESVSSKYTDIGTHAGYRPICEFVQTCAEPGQVHQSVAAPLRSNHLLGFIGITSRLILT